MIGRVKGRRGGAAALLLAATLATACARPARAEAFRLPPLAARRHGGRPRDAVAMTPSAGQAIYRLPADYRGPTGGVDQTALVAQQKRRLAAINRTVGTNLKAAETSHYLIFSDADEKVTRQFKVWSEALYRSLLQQFRLPSTARVWDGKCMLLLFNRRRDFETYAFRVDGSRAQNAGAYFAVENHGPNHPALVHMCLPIETTEARRLQELFAHEGTHAFFELYKTPGRLPLWLHEGLAEYMTTVNDEGLRPPKWMMGRRVAQSGRSIQRMFTVPVGGELTVPEYGAAFTLVDFLLKTGRPKFKAFIDNLKDGKPQEEALQEAYSFGLADLQRRWRVYAARGTP